MKDAMFTLKGDRRGYIESENLTELWFHTGTICNLRCPFCLEGSAPGDTRIQALSLDDVKPYIKEALKLGVEQFAFTGGEPFVIRDFIQILDHALDYRPCMVLTNGTRPLIKREKECIPFWNKPHELKFRISLDFPDRLKHDAGRGNGNFQKALDTLARLHDYGFKVSVARQSTLDEDPERVDQLFKKLLKANGLPEEIPIVRFPDFLRPGSVADVPEITESCMTHYHDQNSRADFMCHNSKFVLKKKGQMRVYACTLVDDDARFDLGKTLTESLDRRIMLAHHRCYTCFAYGATCSEL